MVEGAGGTEGDPVGAGAVEEGEIARPQDGQAPILLGLGDTVEVHRDEMLVA